MAYFEASNLKLAYFELAYRKQAHFETCTFKIVLLLELPQSGLNFHSGFSPRHGQRLHQYTNQHQLERITWDKNKQTQHTLKYTKRVVVQVVLDSLYNATQERVQGPYARNNLHAFRRYTCLHWCIRPQDHLLKAAVTSYGHARGSPRWVMTVVDRSCP